MDNFLKKYKNLNKEQKEAVDTIEGPVMVIAGPGTGKTTILTLRIANILRKTDTPPSGILAITFTDAGVKSMKMKLKEIIGDVALQVRIHTFHSFAASIISEFEDHFVHLSQFSQINEIDQQEMLRKILDDLAYEDEKFHLLRPIGNVDFYIKHILGAISKSKNEAYMPEKVLEFAREEIKRIRGDDSNISTRGATKGELKAEAKKKIEKCEKTILFSKIYELYEERKRKEKKMDYNDLIIEVLAKLQNDELLLRMIQEKFLYILVDEHQDTNDSQNLLISLISEFYTVPNVFIVGDERQAIYRFQGASVQNFLRFRKAWPQIKLINLIDNYRSHQGILDASHNMIEKNYNSDEYKELRTRLISNEDKDKSRPIDIITGINNISIENYLIEQLRSITKHTNQTVAVITRTNKDLENILQVFKNNNIKASALRNIDIFKHPLSIIYFDLLNFIVDPTNVEALSKTLVAGLWNLSFEDMIAFIRALKSQTIQPLQKSSFKSKGKNVDIIDIYIPRMRSILNEINSEDIIGFLINSAEQSGLNKIILKDPAFMEVWRQIINLAQAISREYEIKDVQSLIRRLISYRDSAESRSVKINIGTSDLPIQVMTAHSSKGLEYDHVFVMYANEETWINRVNNQYFILPQNAKQDEEDNIKDLRRLFYVALTRAKKHASVLYSSQDMNQRSVTPLRFISELDSKNTNIIELDYRYNVSTDYSLTINKSDKERGTYRSRLTDHAKNIITEKGLSVTALNHFIECPLQFMVKSILKLPESPVAIAEKGTAMHRAFHNIWRHRKGDKDGPDLSSNEIEKILKDSVYEYMESSFLPQKDKKRVNKEVFEIAKNISRSLNNHFNQKGKVFAETWSETTLDIGGKKILIHGKLDAIVENEKEVHVYDYKTREKMSLAEIKGETKNSNGNYLRQLIFYKLLLENDSRFVNKKIIPNLVFVVPDNRGNCSMVNIPITEEDIVRVKDEISTLIEAIWKGNIFDIKCGEDDCEWESLFDFV